jgi:hypothetical protein
MFSTSNTQREGQVLIYIRLLNKNFITDKQMSLSINDPEGMFHLTQQEGSVCWGPYLTCSIRYAVSFEGFTLARDIDSLLSSTTLESRYRAPGANPPWHENTPGLWSPLQHQRRIEGNRGGSSERRYLLMGNRKSSLKVPTQYSLVLLWKVNGERVKLWEVKRVKC